MIWFIYIILERTFNKLSIFLLVFNFCLFVNDPSAGSPTETLLRLLLPLNNKIYCSSRTFTDSTPRRTLICKNPIRTFHLIIQSVGATGGVYKGQGRNQRNLMNCTYQVFLVHDPKLQRSIPITRKIHKITQPFRARIESSLSLPREEPEDPTSFPTARMEKKSKKRKTRIFKLVDFLSVARVRPRTSKGITDLLLPHASPMCNHGCPSKKSLFLKQSPQTSIPPHQPKGITPLPSKERDS